MSITTHTSTIRQYVKNHTKDDIALFFEHQFAAKEAEKRAALNLLAVMHRDGGHHEGAVGFVQACKDAEEVRHKLCRDLDAKDAEIADLKDTLQRFQSDPAYDVGKAFGMESARAEIERLKAENEALKLTIYEAIGHISRADLMYIATGVTRLAVFMNAERNEHA